MRDSTSDPTDRKPDNPDAGDGSRDHKHPIFAALVENRVLGHNLSAASAPVLAAFDVETSAIWANDALAHAIARSKKVPRKLRDEDVETLVHEFARALEFEDVLKEYRSQRDRVAVMRKRLSVSVSRSTEEAFMNRMLIREHQAEEWVQRIRMEILSTFDQAQHGPGLTESAIANKAEGLTSEWMTRLHDGYLTKARNEYRRFVRRQTASSGARNSIDELWSSPDLVQVFVKSITGMFPLDQSATLKKLIGLMVTYEMTIYVPALSDDGT